MQKNKNRFKKIRFVIQKKYFCKQKHTQKLYKTTQKLCNLFCKDMQNYANKRKKNNLQNIKNIQNMEYLEN